VHGICRTVGGNARRESSELVSSGKGIPGVMWPGVAKSTCARRPGEVAKRTVSSGGDAGRTQSRGAATARVARRATSGEEARAAKPRVLLATRCHEAFQQLELGRSWPAGTVAGAASLVGLIEEPLSDPLVHRRAAHAGGRRLRNVFPRRPVECSVFTRCSHQGTLARSAEERGQRTRATGVRETRSREARYAAVASRRSGSRHRAAIPELRLALCPPHA
jgi:hypothetical protein